MGLGHAVLLFLGFWIGWITKEFIDESPGPITRWWRDKTGEKPNYPPSDRFR
jgi:hypothetical protein